MNEIKRFSSRRNRLDKAFLAQRLNNAQNYDRIAGYFNASLLELVSEELDSVSGLIRVVCNSALQSRDVETAKAAVAAQWKAWGPNVAEYLMDDNDDPQEIPLRKKFTRLYEMLLSQKLEVKVLPDDAFGLIHGKAGVITLADGSQTSFMGSANDTANAWRVNYELVWEDPSPEGVTWVQEEFDALWNHPSAYPLSKAVINDIGRLGSRTLITRDEWVQGDGTTPDPGSAVIESPVFRKELGLWEHQKYFVQKAFMAHNSPIGKARFVLADQVGLGKTIQLAMTAQLIALIGTKPILVLCPKTLINQWQDELKVLLDLPSAIWNGKSWIDENKLVYPAEGPVGVRKCPRRVGIVSTGLVTMLTETREHLLSLEYDCVILDEAHRARRKNLGPNKDNQSADANNLLDFMNQIAYCTRSLMLATATPVQLRPIEAFDLLNILNNGDHSVLGNFGSRWLRYPNDMLRMIMGQDPLPENALIRWELMTNPLPAAGEDIGMVERNLSALRQNLHIPDHQTTLGGDHYLKLSPPDKQRTQQMFPRFIEMNNPYINRIVRRTRNQLETTIDPQTGEPFLKAIGVELFGEKPEEAITLPGYLRAGYEKAEEFCVEVGKRARSVGFLRTLLLRRLGSSILAGMNTAKSMLGVPLVELLEENEEEDQDETAAPEMSEFAQSLNDAERRHLIQMIEAFEKYKKDDPKFESVLRYLSEKNWLQEGCIVFSQYRDSLHGLLTYLSNIYPEEPIALYSGSTTSGLMRGGKWKRAQREKIKRMVRDGELRLLLGTDAASEGLNLQRLSTLINLDLPWNPTRLEQRKGRIQRIGQMKDTVLIYNMRYKGSVEDRVHDLLSSRLQEIYGLFGQLPDVLEDVWVNAAQGEIEAAKLIIDQVPRQHPFSIKNTKVENVEWESCSRVLSEVDKKNILMQGW